MGLVSATSGASFTAVTVSVKFSDALAAPSDTVTVMVAVPLMSCAGVTVTALFAPLPVNAIADTGTSAVLDDIAVSARFPAGVSRSSITNGIAGVGVSSFVVRSVICVIVGVWL